MPLGAILKILGDTKAEDPANTDPLKKTNPLAGGSEHRAKLKILTKKDFKPFSKIKSKDINDDFLGFFSLLTSYCVLADLTTPKDGPKHLLAIMPRTDFVTQYTNFAKPILESQLAKGKVSLYDIVEKVSGSDSTLGQGKFKWKAGTITEIIPEDWAGKPADLQAGTLEVKKFLNYIEGYDKETKQDLPQMDLLKLMDKTMRHGQIGGLGNKMETRMGTSELVPIFEFRNLKPPQAPDLGFTMGQYENTVFNYHDPLAKRSIDSWEEEDMLQEE